MLILKCIKTFSKPKGHNAQTWTTGFPFANIKDKYILKNNIANL